MRVTRHETEKEDGEVFCLLLYATETWTLRKKEETRLLQPFEMRTRIRMERILWKDRATEEEVLGKVGEKEEGWYTDMKRNWLGHCTRQTRGNVMVEAHDGLANVKRNRRRRSCLLYTSRCV